MKVILRIAGLELGTLFYSPVAWLILIVFTVQCGSTFTDLLKMLETFSRMGNSFPSLTDQLFYWQGFPRGFFPEVQSYLYLYFPLLTMGLMSREYSSGSIKLLYSSPVTVWEIVAGKFLAMMGYGLALVGVLGLYVIAGALSIGAMELGMVLTGLFGLYLLIGAYSAIGLYMSSLTPYQVVAAISTLVVLAGLNYIGRIGQDILLVRDLTYFLSISGRTGSFVAGLISSKDLLYFLLVIGMFLGFTWLKLQSGRESRSRAVRVSRYAGLVAAVLLVGYATSRPAVTGYIDVTSNNRRTLTEYSQAVVRRMMDKPLTITSYVNILDQNYMSGMPFQYNENLRLFEPYLRFKPDIDLKYVYYWAPSRNEELYKLNPGQSDEELARTLARGWNLDLLTPEEIDRKIQLKPEEYRLVRQFEYDGNTSFVRMFQDSQFQPGEREISTGLKRLLDGPVKVGFASGHGERQIDRSDDRNYNRASTALTFRYSLINQGFDPVQFSLVDGQIPADLDILVVADPMQVYSDTDREKIARFAAGGGHLLIAGEAGREIIANPLSEPFGLTLTGNTLTRKSDKFADDFILASLSDEAVRKIGETRGIYREDSRILRGAMNLYADGAEVSMPGVTGIESRSPAAAGEFTAYRLLEADVETGGETGKPVATAMALEREVSGVPQRIVVLGDADFMSNSELTRENATVSNLSFVLETFKWLSGGAYPIDTSRPDSRDTDFTVDAAGIFTFRVLFFGVIPGLMVLGGGLLLLRRRRK